MAHKAIGIATIDGGGGGGGGVVTTIRQYDNGIFTVEADGNVVFSGMSLDEIIEKLNENKIKYSIPSVFESTQND
ncbi:hypothetical protein [Limnohabitans sp.]